MRSTASIAIPAAITKAELGEVVQLYGRANVKPCHGHDIGALEFMTFAGALNLESGKYEGHYLFREISDGDQREGADFDALPGLPKKERKKK